MNAPLPATDVGIASLTDIQSPTVDGRNVTTGERHRRLVVLGETAERLGLDHIGIGEHHSPDFAVSSPAVVLAAIAARTSTIRLTSSVSTLSTLDPVRLYEDFATLDLVSAGRAEVTVGRSAYPDPFRLFGVPMEKYDAVFEEKLELFLRVRGTAHVTWRGRFRSGLDAAAVVPRAQQDPLPVWVGVGGTPESAERAGRLGLPMMLGYIGGPAERLAYLAARYRAAGEEAGTTDRLRLGLGVHFFATDSAANARDTYPYYREFLRPKSPNGGGFTVLPEQFEAGLGPHGHLLVGTPEHITEKALRLHEAIRFDRLQALVDWGGLPEDAVGSSLEHLGRTIAPALRDASHHAAPA
ncbi:LLM class flavin-dependent oxidoreductase [Streptomyces liangshanensis]|uniref:LLM class flavin-dependent oxidoreductase n=1 Tax=Streptomyces liangshanensis TaxID=2717324 RepID=A0A6G9H763_9ACTN|nr:LLM class flavin-dependent oxidoreductase [Streptomyces liangshanensis]QIQ06051.1 LLM class flavin-dependent oxidoreductase [Streptomyces liangshanensis]